MGKVIAIDLGHECYPDIGADGVISEENIIDAVGSLVISGLRELGNTVVETRPNSCTSVSNSLSQRYNKSDDNNVDWCISIHANASEGSGHGTEIYTMGGKEITEARNILNNIVSVGGFANRGIKDGSSLAMVKYPKAKAMLIEILFCDNASDIEKYNSVGAKAIANAIIKGLTGQTVSSQYKLGWNQNSNSWFYCTDVANGYYYKDTWKLIDNEWYSFNNKGYSKQSEWELYKNQFYYLKDSCKMAKSEWVWWNDECYYLNKDGIMITNCFSEDGYWLNSDGTWNKKAKGIN